MTGRPYFGQRGDALGIRDSSADLPRGMLTQRRRDAKEFEFVGPMWCQTWTPILNCYEGMSQGLSII